MKLSSKIQKKKNQFLAGTLVVMILLIASVTLTVLTAYETNLNIDLTEQKVFTLSQESQKVLESVAKQDKQVRIAAVYPAGREETMVVKLLKEYAKKSKNIKIESIDAEEDPSKLSDYPLGDVLAVYNGSLIIECEERVKIINSEDLFTASAEGRFFYGEREITGAVKYVTADELPAVYFTTGHGEISAGKDLLHAVSELRRNAYDPKSLVMLQGGIPEDASILIMASPTQDISEEEQTMLQDYLERGGGFMLLLDPFMTTNTNLLEHINNLTHLYGIDISNNYVVEENSGYYLAASDMYLIPRFSSHEITAPIGEAEKMVIFPIARGLGAADYDEKQVERSILLLSSDKAWARNDMTIKSENKTETDIIGPIVLGFAAERQQETTSRIVVFGDSNFVTDGNYDMQADSVLFMNSVNWLHDGADLEDISGKKINSDTLLVRGNTFNNLVILCCLILPLLAFICAILIWFSERNR